MSRDVIADEVWELFQDVFPPVRTLGRPPVDRRTVVEATAWRDLPERFGSWNTIHKNVRRWAVVLTGGQVADTSMFTERDDQIEKRRKKPGRPIDFGGEQQEPYTGRTVIERCFSFIKQWRGLASRYDKTACSYAAGLCLSAALHWI